MRPPTEIAVWAAVGVALLLLLLSFGGMGTGFARTGIMTHMFWSYLIAAAFVGILVWAILEGRAADKRQQGR